MLRIGQECGQTWPTDDEVRAILKNDPRAIGTLYGTHYAIRFAHKQMVTIPVDLADAHRDTAQVELREVNPFGLRSTVTSNATLPTQGQAVCSGEWQLPRAAGSLLQDTRRARQVLEGEVSAKTEPAESPMNERSEAMPMGVQVGEDDCQSVPTRQHSV